MSARWSLLPCCLVAFAALAQEQPYLSAFDLTDQEDAVRLNWTMVAGSTCQGTDVLRGRDSLQLNVVGGLAGLCGSIDGPTTYDFTDTSVPGFGTWYYRLRLGLNGYSQLRSIDHLLSSASDLRVQPNPVSDEVTLVLRADDRSEVSLRIVATDGRVMIERTVLSGNVHRLPVHDLPAGMYVVVAQWEGRMAKGRFQVL